jgi:curved DNA-binding protein CbpA
VTVPDPYKVLQVDPEADEEVIKAAYKHLARKFHPDVSPDPESVEKMVRINQAWELLRDPVRRAAVDRARQRNAATTARVVAADGRAGAAARATHAHPPPSSGTGGRPAPPPSWPFPGMVDPSSGPFSAAGPEAGERSTSASWTSGRSNVGYRYEPGTMGAGSAGSPPGNPSGSLVTFGRYSGWTLGEIARVDLEYLEWLDRMPIGRTYQQEIDKLLRTAGRRASAAGAEERRRGLFRRR